MRNFLMTDLTFRVTFMHLTFGVLLDLEFSHSQFQAAELIWRQLKTKSNDKPLMSLFKAPSEFFSPIQAYPQLKQAAID